MQCLSHCCESCTSLTLLLSIKLCSFYYYYYYYYLLKDVCFRVVWYVECLLVVTVGWHVLLVTARH